MVRLELHIRDALVLQARLKVVLGLPLPLDELLLGYPSLFLLEVLLPVEGLFDAVLYLADMLELSQAGDLLKADSFLQSCCSQPAFSWG